MATAPESNIGTGSRSDRFTDTWEKRFQPTMKNLYKQMSLYNIIVTCILIYRNNFSAKSSRIRFKTYLLIENLC